MIGSVLISLKYLFYFLCRYGINLGNISDDFELPNKGGAVNSPPYNGKGFIGK